MPQVSTRRRVPHSAAEMFDLVADVEQYPWFVPFCSALKVRRREPGEGETEVFLDELSVGPVPTALTRARAEPPKGPSVRTIADRPRGPNEPLEAVQPGLNSKIRLDRNRLTKDGYPWFFTAVRAPDADPFSAAAGAP